MKRNNEPDLPKPTQKLQAREAPLELDKNQGKTMVVSSTRGPGQPGYHCEVCTKTYKDSGAYLDHINGKGRTFTQH